MRIGIIIGSVREGRSGQSVAEWVDAVARKRDDATFELVDLKDFNLPILTDPVVPGAANREYGTAEARTWGAAIDSYDGFIFVTPEYNHGVPGAFKNAFDTIGPEWAHKAVGLVSYGAEGGVRAVEQWRQVLANLHVVAVRGQVSLGLFTEFGENGVQPNERREDELGALIGSVVEMSAALAPLRGATVGA
ncbi:NADPH-dependent FMN reductase [Georgenia sp. Z1344]|uniref:NADPH-dependent FMN reductase n=1 Tax=Georgenia sp. Z1344 TaxID=3416706 RepID=UPI003CE96F9A